MDPSLLARSQNATAEARALQARAEAARVAARVAIRGAYETVQTSREIVRTTYGLLVAAEVRGDRVVAHAVFDIGALSRSHGLTLCGLLAGDEALIVPDLWWREAVDGYRCDDCTAASKRIPA